MSARSSIIGGNSGGSTHISNISENFSVVQQPLPCEEAIFDSEFNMRGLQITGRLPTSVFSGFPHTSERRNFLGNPSQPFADTNTACGDMRQRGATLVESLAADEGSECF